MQLRNDTASITVLLDPWIECYSVPLQSHLQYFFEVVIGNSSLVHLYTYMYSTYTLLLLIFWDLSNFCNFHDHYKKIVILKVCKIKLKRKYMYSNVILNILQSIIPPHHRRLAV